MTLNPKEVLKQTFGYEEFRQGQSEIISSIVNKKNVLYSEILYSWRAHLVN